MAKIDIQKVDCCDVCFEKYRFSPKKMKNPIVSIKANGKEIKLCREHTQEIQQEMFLFLNS